MNKIFGTVFAIIAGLTITGLRADAAPPGYNLVWSDEFNQGAGSVPNPSVWNYDTGAGGWGNNELETYVNSQANSHIISDAAATDGQALQIEVQTDTSGNYYSARLNTGGKVGLGPYGYIEYRCQLPGNNASGMWPAGWALGTNGQAWPYCGEIDVMEQVNGQEINHGSLHAPNNYNPTATLSVAGLTTAYHTYGALWQPGSITFYVDGQAYETQTSSGAPSGSWVFDGQQIFVILNCAVGGNFPGNPSSPTIPADLKFDYVRFYQNNGQNPAEGPYGGTPAALPGTVQAENYDVGGQNVAYNESGFNGSADYYRVDGNDIETTTDTGGGYDVGWTNNGQWMKYTVNATSGGAYTVACRVANGTTTNGTFHFQNSSGTNLTGEITVPPTGGYQTWTTVNANVTLPAGQQTLELVEDTGGYNINYLNFTFNQPVEGPYGGTPATIPGTVQAENYDTGGQGVAYNVSSTNGSANSYRSDGIDLETTTDTGGGYDLGWSAAGQWFKYTVNVPTAGTYTVGCRVANGTTTSGTLHIQNASGTNLSGSVTVPATGGWQTWTTVNATVVLPAGQQTLEVAQDGGGYNMNYFTFTAAATTPPAPTGLTASASNSTVALNWTGSSGAASYNVYRGTAAGGESTTPIATGVTGTSYTNSGLTNGTTYYFKVAAVNSAGTSGLSNEASAKPSSGSSGEGPYGGTPAAIPGTVQAENYDTGGAGVGYNATAGNGSANSYRSDGIDLETTTDTGGGYDVGWTASGQWFRYTVNVATAGNYTVSFRLASPNAVTDGLHLSNSSGTNLSGNVNVPATGGYQTWTTVTATVTLPAGQQTLTLNEDNGGWNINYITFASSGGGGTKGSLSGAVTAVTGSDALNLTSLGTTDWAVWGYNNTTFTHDASGGSQIGNVSTYGGGTPGPYNNAGYSYFPMSWTNGTPTASVSGEQWLYTNAGGVGDGFQFTVPAGTTSHKLIVYVGGWETGGTLTATLSDGSAAAYTDSSQSNSGSSYYAYYTLTYNAASAGQTLTVVWKQASGTGNVDLFAAALQ